MAASGNKRLRIRHAAGSTTIGVKGGSTLKEVATLIEQSVKIPAKEQCWKVGFPPKPHPKIDASEVLPADIDLIHVSKDAANATILFAPTVLAPILDDSALETPHLMDSDGYVVRRVIDADNSCLFNSIGYGIHDRHNGENIPQPTATQLRAMIAKAVLEDPSTFHEAFLGRPTDEYATWIQKDTSWGGQIELSIFSQLFRTEIAAFDVVRNRHDVYGGESNYKRRICCLYDGIHYDAMAFTLDPSLPESMDATQFSPNDIIVMKRATALCEQQHRAKAFTDTSNFTLRCLVCQQGLKGQADAAKHATATGHTNFSEYR